LAGCRNASQQWGAEKADSSKPAVADTTPKKSADTADRESVVLSPERLDTLTFADKVRNLYAMEKTRVPKHLMDSAIGLKDPVKINAVLEKYMTQQDSMARNTIAAKLGIGVDSVNKILKETVRK